MTEANARAMIQTWAEMDNVRVYEPGRKNRRRAEPEQPRKKIRRTPSLEQFKKRYGILLIAAAAFTIYTIILSNCVEISTEKRVRKEMADAATQAVEQYKADLKKQEDDANEEKKKSGFLTGEESLQNYIQILAKPLSVHVACLRMERKVTAAGAETYAWVDIARLESGLYGSTLEEVLSDPVQIEGYIEGHGTRPEDDEIGYRVAEAYVMKHYPTGYTKDMQFAEIKADGSVEARNEYKTSSNTRYFSIGK